MMAFSKGFFVIVAVCLVAMASAFVPQSVVRTPALMRASLLEAARSSIPAPAPRSSIPAPAPRSSIPAPAPRSSIPAPAPRFNFPAPAASAATAAAVSVFAPLAARAAESSSVLSKLPPQLIADNGTATLAIVVGMFLPCAFLITIYVGTEQKKAGIAEGQQMGRN